MRNAITISDADTIEGAKMELVQSLKPLADDGLARFYAHLPYPGELGPEVFIETSDWMKAKLREIKDRAERLVMGDRYEELYATGEEPEKSFWAADCRLAGDYASDDDDDDVV